VVIDWGSVITQVLVVVLPVVVSAVIAWVGSEWAKLLKNQSYGKALQTITNMASSLIQAAYQIGEAQGWDAQKRHDYVLDQMKALAAKMHIPLTGEELDAILDAILEGTYRQSVVYKEIPPMSEAPAVDAPVAEAPAA
jgi:hypothetical protein